MCRARAGEDEMPLHAFAVHELDPLCTRSELLLHAALPILIACSYYGIRGFFMRLPGADASLEKCGYGGISGGVSVKRMRVEHVFDLKNSDKMRVRRWPAWKKIYPDSLGIVMNRKFGPYWKSRSFEGTNL